MKLIKKSKFRVQGMFFSTIVLYYNCITPISGNVHAFHTIQPSYLLAYMSHSQMLGKVEYGGGPIFKVVLEC